MSKQASAEKQEKEKKALQSSMTAWMQSTPPVPKPMAEKPKPRRDRDSDCDMSDDSV